MTNVRNVSAPPSLERPQSIQEAWAEYAGRIKWQWFVTLTFPWSVSDDVGDAKLSAFFNELGRAHGTSLAVLVGRERISRSGARVPLHFHVILHSTLAIDPALIEYTWLTLVGRAGSTEQQPSASDLIQIASYDSTLHGIEYVTKQATLAGGGVDFRNLQLYDDEIGRRSASTSQSRRRRRRFVAQRERDGLLASAQSSTGPELT